MLLYLSSYENVSHDACNTGLIVFLLECFLFLFCSCFAASSYYHKEGFKACLDSYDATDVGLAELAFRVVFLYFFCSFLFLGGGEREGGESSFISHTYFCGMGRKYIQ